MRKYAELGELEISYTGTRRVDEAPSEYLRKVKFIHSSDTKPDFHSSVIIIDITDQPEVEVGWVYREDGTFTAPPPPRPQFDVVHTPGAVPSEPAQRMVDPTQLEVMGYFGNVWIRAHRFAKAGDTFEGHKHNFDHVSFLTKGKVRVTANGATTDYSAINFIVINKDVDHSIVALEDNTEWWCVFAVRDDNGEVVDIVNHSQHNPLYFAE